MANRETSPESHQFSFAESFLDSLKWGEPNTGVPLDKFLEFLQNSPMENFETHKTSRKGIDIEFPISNRLKHRLSEYYTFVTDAENPQIKNNKAHYSPKSYLAWVTRIRNSMGYYDYTVFLDTLLRVKFDHLQTELIGEETPLIPNLISLPMHSEETPAKSDEGALQSAFIPILRAS